MGSQTSKKKSEGRGSQRGVIGDGLTDGRNPPLFFFKWLCHAYYPTTLPPPPKIRLKKKSKKKV